MLSEGHDHGKREEGSDKRTSLDVGDEIASSSSTTTTTTTTTTMTTPNKPRAAASTVLVGADLTNSDNVKRKLLKNVFGKSLFTVWLLEGVILYLKQEELASLLSTIQFLLSPSFSLTGNDTHTHGGSQIVATWLTLKHKSFRLAMHRFFIDHYTDDDFPLGRKAHPHPTTKILAKYGFTKVLEITDLKKVAESQNRFLLTTCIASRFQLPPLIMYYCFSLRFLFVAVLIGFLFVLRDEQQLLSLNTLDSNNSMDWVTLFSKLTMGSRAREATSDHCGSSRSSVGWTAFIVVLARVIDTLSSDRNHYNTLSAFSTEQSLLQDPVAVSMFSLFNFNGAPLQSRVAFAILCNNYHCLSNMKNLQFFLSLRSEIVRKLEVLVNIVALQTHFISLH